MVYRELKTTVIQDDYVLDVETADIFEDDTYDVCIYDFKPSHA